MSRKILVTGCNGQIGSALLKILKEYSVGIDIADLDFTNTKAIAAGLEKINPKAIINTAAYTQVDRAESEKNLAHSINALAPEAIAQWCKSKDVPLVHYSTDYVYPGTGTDPMTEDREYDPCNYYGETKLNGDKRIINVNSKFLIFRTCWVYDATGKNFLNTILRLAGEREELSIVSDQIGSPSFAHDLARATIDTLVAAMQMPTFPSSVYHLCNSGYTSWHEFSEKIISGARGLGATLRVQKLKPISSEEYKSPAKRPKNSRLSTEKLKRVFGISMPTWQDGLNRCLKEKYGSQ